MYSLLSLIFRFLQGYSLLELILREGEGQDFSTVQTSESLSMSIYQTFHTTRFYMATQIKKSREFGYQVLHNLTSNEVDKFGTEYNGLPTGASVRERC